MKYVFMCLLLVLSSGILAQETEQVNFYSSTLQIGEMLNLGNRSLKFKNVVSDSRCPKDVTCIWAGEAIVSVEVYEDGKCIEEKLIVVTPSNISLKFTSGNMMYSIAGLGLSPIPSVKNHDISGEYKLHMKVRETERI